jgi:hypothetical protein
MRVGTPPLQMSQQVGGLLRSGPGTASERGYPMSDGQWSPLNERRVEPSRETYLLSGHCEICRCPKAHHRGDARQLAPPVAFLHLAVDQARRHLPLTHFPPSTNQLKPLTKVGCEGIKVQIETITREERQAARGQHLSERMDDRLCHVLCSGTQMEHRKKLGTRVDGQPKPQHLCGAAQPGAQFV